MAVSPKERQQYALQTIFSFFLGLMVLAFIGIGVNTFYPQPEYRESPEMRELFRQQERIYQRDRTGEGLSAADEAELERIQTEIDELSRAEERVRQDWSRNTSIVLILFATLVMGISLVRSDQLRVISNGLLLGGLFTMVYGVGWIIASGESVGRFIVIVFALGVTLALGYLRFVRRHEAAPATSAPATAGVPLDTTAALAGTSASDTGHLAALAARVEALEARAAAAAAALGATQQSDTGQATEE